MNKHKFAIRGFVFSMLIWLVLPMTTLASTNPFLQDKGSGITFNQQVNNWTNQINDTAPTISFIINAIFTIMFLFGVVRMGYSMVTKTGHVMKFSTNLMIWVPIVVFSTRVFLLLLFTTSGKDVTLVANDIIHFIQYIGYYLAIGMVLVGLTLFLFYRLIKHPEFGRWSKRLWALSGTLILLLFFMPYVLGAA